MVSGLFAASLPGTSRIGRVLSGDVHGTRTVGAVDQQKNMISDELTQTLLSCEVVLDMVSPYVYIGRLAGEDVTCLVLDDADVHDLRDSSTTRELYVLDCKRHGVGANRRRVYVLKNQ